MKGKGKGKEVLLRYNGEVIEGEHPAVLRDPRKEGRARKLSSLRPQRTEFMEVKYEVCPTFHSSLVLLSNCRLV